MVHLRTRLLLSTQLLSCLMATGAASQNCRLAHLTSYGSGNPVTLRSVFPGQYMVPGTATMFEAVASEPIAFLALGLRGSAIPLPSPIVGDLLLDPSSVTFIPGAGPNPRWSIGVSLDKPLGALVAAQSFHFDFVRVRASNGLEFTVGAYQPQIGISRIELPVNVIGGVGPRVYRVHYVNSGPAPATFAVTVTVGPNFNTNGGSVSGFGSGYTDVLVPTPPAAGSPGSFVNYQVTACHNFTDCDPTNNCARTSVPVYVPYWDLRLRLVSAPSSICVGSGTTANWSVEVRNAGNKISGGYRIQTGINCSSGQGFWNCQPNLPIPLNGLPLGGGQTVSFPVHYIVPGNTWRQTQWIKAEVMSGDAIGTGNYVEHATVIRC